MGEREIKKNKKGRKRVGIKILQKRQIEKSSRKKEK